jgi:hypothetical protein
MSLPIPSLSYLDHLIFFVVPTGNGMHLEDYPSLTHAFTYVPGGVHADKITENMLIPLADGSYIELIRFRPEADRHAITEHWWGPDLDRQGWADWCLTTLGGPADLQPINRPGDPTPIYAAPIPGGRTRLDGKRVEWNVTFPFFGKGPDDPNTRNGQPLRGLLPFFCHDTTRRVDRVPKFEITRPHPCGALGVLRIVVLALPEWFKYAKKIYTRIFDTGVAFDTDGTIWVFEAERVRNIPELHGRNVQIRLCLARGELAESLHGRNFMLSAVVLGANAAAAGKKEGTLVKILDDENLGAIHVEYV